MYLWDIFLASVANGKEWGVMPSRPGRFWEKRDGIVGETIIGRRDDELFKDLLDSNWSLLGVWGVAVHPFRNITSRIREN